MRGELFSRLAKFRKELRPIEDICYLEHKYNDKLIPLAAKYNLLGIPVPKKYGGEGVNSFSYAHALMEIGREGTGVRTFFSGHTSLGQKMILDFGDEVQKKEYLKASCAGKKVLAYGLTEPDAGSDPLSLKTRFTKKGKDYVLNGVKYLISNGGIADSIVVFARGPDKRISAFIVDTDQKGISRETMTAKMGMPTINTGMFELKNFVCPHENLLGTLGNGWDVAHHGLMSGRLSVAAGCVGVMQDCIDEAVHFAKDRVQHGKPIAKHQLIQEHIAAMKIQYEAAALLVEKAASWKDAYEASGTKDSFEAADQAICEAKLYAAQSSFDVADRAVQILGGRGWSFLYRPGRHLVDTRVCRIYEGTDEIMKLKIASGVLGKEFRAYS